MHEQDYSAAGSSILFGFTLSVGNHLFGWLNNINGINHLNDFLQAVFTGFVGATVAFFTNMLWKKVTAKKRKHYQDQKTDTR